MKNKKGFTLVELLAVIALIAVLSVVAIATYRGINESSKKKTLDAKIAQIETAAEKWAKENNITSRMNISVNTLVVEGYLSADEVGPDGLSVIKNPVDGNNLICNVVEISFKDGVIQPRFNRSSYDCKLATQSLIDNNINIKIISASGDNLTGTGSIAKWSNEDIVIIVNSDTYDNKATSISYDFEGNTVTKDKSSLTKYSETAYISEEDSKLYYNVYYIKAELLLNTKIVITYDIPGEGTKSREYTIRFDKEEATVAITNNNDWLTDTQPLNVKLDDGKGSGPKYIYISTNPDTFDVTNPTPASYNGISLNLDVGKYFVWTEDNAGNRSNTYKLEFEVNNVDSEEPGCEILFHGTEGLHGWYISNVTPGAQNTPEASISGVNIGFSLNNSPTYSGFAKYQTQTEVQLPEVATETTTSGIDYYCFTKSLAGKTGNGTRNLKIDKTPPTISINVNNANTYTQNKVVRVTISDSLSGLNSKSNYKVGLSNSSSAPPSEWTNLAINATAGAREAQHSAATAFEVTGNYYVWIDASEITDYAGNHLPQQYYVSGVGKFDNTPPTCVISNISNQCSTNGISLIVGCSDTHSGVFSCAGAQTGIKETKMFVASDQAGNSSYCAVEVTATTQYRRAYCITGERCAAAGCEEAAYCTRSCCGTTTRTFGMPFNRRTCSLEGYSWSFCGDNCPSECFDGDGYGGYCCVGYETVNSTCQSESCCGCETYNRDIDECGCEEWGNWSAWQNVAITGCTLNRCKRDSRIVYHSGGSCNESIPTGGACYVNNIAEENRKSFNVAACS